MIAVRLLGLLACGVAASGASAAQPAPLTAPAAQPPMPAAARPGDGAQLGRFFFTPAQRAALDEARRRPPAAVAATTQGPPLPPAPEYVTLNGVVRRSDGTTTVWLNNKPVRGSQSEDGLQIAPSTRSAAPGNVTVRVPQTGRVVNLKVGQQVDVTSGQVEEGYRSSRPPQVAAEAPPSQSEPRGPRRADRDRELLRDLLREMEAPPSSRADPALSASPAAP